MSATGEPRCPPGRDPAQVPVHLVAPGGRLDAFAADLRRAARVAIDTETVYDHATTSAAAPGRLRVVSAAVRRPDGTEAAWVVDARDLHDDRRATAGLAAALDGVAADGWNAGFDAFVLERDVFRPAGLGPGRGVRWWDAQLADALLHAGVRSWYHGLAWASEHLLGIVAEGKGTVQLSYDAASQLSAAQVAYAAADAVETLWVGDVLRRLLDEEGLTPVADLEMAARPWLGELERRGAPCDRDGLERLRRGLAGAREAVRSTLAEVTGGGQGSLFSEHVEPTWDPASAAEARAALNRFARPDVEACFARREGAPRLLTAEDRLDDVVLAEVGGPLAHALRQHAALSAQLAQAERILGQLGADDRLRSRYLQVIGSPDGVPVGRSPDPAGLPPPLRALVRPSTSQRAFVAVQLTAPAVAPSPASTVAAAEISWPRTLRLHDELGPLQAWRRAFRDEHRRWPSRGEVLAARPGTPRWVLDHEAAVALGEDGRPLRWAARSPLGRRRWFVLRTSDLLRRAVEALTASDDVELGRRWRAFVGHVPLPSFEATRPSTPNIRAADRRALVADLWAWSSTRTARLLDAAAAAALDELAVALAASPAQMALADAVLAAAAELSAAAEGEGSGVGADPVALVGATLVFECAAPEAAAAAGRLAALAERAGRRAGVPGLEGRIEVVDALPGE